MNIVLSFKYLSTKNKRGDPMIKKLLITVFLLVGFSTVFTQEKPAISFEEAIIASEINPQLIAEARRLTAKQNIPHTIYIPRGVFIQAEGIERGRVVFAVYKNLLDIYEGGETMFWEEIQSEYDLRGARLHYLNKPIINPDLGFPKAQNPEVVPEKMLLIPDWTSDGVMTFDATTGDLLNQTYIVDPTNLSSPKEVNLSPWGSITVSDQVDDGVIEYDTSGTFTIFFAPAGGVNNNILDNIRGHNYRPNGNLVVTNAGGSNANSIAEFDQSGNYLGNFIAIGAGGLNSPFDIIFRSSDVLVTASSSNAVHRYDLSGAYLDDFVPSIAFPQQIFEMSNGNIAVAGFSTPSGIYIYDSAGTLVNTLTGVTGVRGVYQIPNGNFITTNGTGVYEVDGTSGTLVRTIVSGVSAQYVSLYDYTTVPVELTTFTAETSEEGITLNWQTATETNNSGFNVERSRDNNTFETLGFVSGFGTTTETHNYYYVDNNLTIGTYYYRLKQIDFDGSFEYSGTIEVDFTSPTEFSLLQNYPNPFNPTTTLQFTLPVDASVMLNVYNLVGEKVAEVINNELAAGLHKIKFNGENLSSGLYLYKLNVIGKDGSNYSAVKKMTLLK